MLGRLLTTLGREIAGLIAEGTYGHDDDIPPTILAWPCVAEPAEEEPEEREPAEPFPGWDAMILALLA